MWEVITVKVGAIFPAFVGAVLYSMRVGVMTWTDRLLGVVTGTATAAYLAPAVIEHLLLDGRIAIGTTFLVGAMGVGIMELVIGVSKDPMGFYNKIRNR